MGGAVSPKRPEFQGANRLETQAGSESQPHLEKANAHGTLAYVLFGGFALRGRRRESVVLL